MMNRIGTGVEKLLFLVLFISLLCNSCYAIAETTKGSYSNLKEGKKYYKIDESVYYSDLFNLEIPLAPKIEIEMIPGGYIIKPDTRVDRILYPYQYQEDNITFRQGLMAKKGYICFFSADRLFYFVNNYFFAQVGNIIYHYIFEIDTVKTEVMSNYATIIYQNSGVELSPGCFVTSSGWIFAYGRFILNEIEASDLVCVYDRGAFLYAYLYQRKPDYIGTASMDAFKQDDTKKEVDVVFEKKERGRSTENIKKDGGYVEVVIPDTLQEVEKLWQVTFPYVPDMSLLGSKKQPTNLTEVINGGFLSEGYEVEPPHWDGDMLTFDMGFDQFYGYNLSPKFSYDGHHIPYLEEIYTITRGKYRYQFTLWGDEQFYAKGKWDDNVNDLFEEQKQTEPDENSKIEWSWDSFKYKFENIEYDGIILEIYGCDFGSTINLRFVSNIYEEDIWVEYSFETGKKMDTWYNRCYLGEWDLRELLDKMW